MVSSTAASVAAYLASLPPDRRAAIARVRDVVNASLPRGFEETMQYGMISWIVPTSRLAETYNGQPLAVASLASQKRHMALYLMSVYSDPALGAWFKAAYKAAGKKLDMGKSCVRFTSLDALPLDVIGEAVAKVPVDGYIASYLAAREGVTSRSSAKRIAAKTPRKRAAAAPKRRPASNQAVAIQTSLRRRNGRVSGES